MLPPLMKEGRVSVQFQRGVDGILMFSKYRQLRKYPQLPKRRNKQTTRKKQMTLELVKQAATVYF